MGDWGDRAAAKPVVTDDDSSWTGQFARRGRDTSVSDCSRSISWPRRCRLTSPRGSRGRSRSPRVRSNSRSRSRRSWDQAPAEPAWSTRGEPSSGPILPTRATLRLRERYRRALEDLTDRNGNLKRAIASASLSAAGAKAESDRKLRELLLANNQLEHQVEISKSDLTRVQAELVSKYEELVQVSEALNEMMKGAQNVPTPVQAKEVTSEQKVKDKEERRNKKKEKKRKKAVKSITITELSQALDDMEKVANIYQAELLNTSNDLAKVQAERTALTLQAQTDEKAINELKKVAQIYQSELIQVQAERDALAVQAQTDKKVISELEAEKSLAAASLEAQKSALELTVTTLERDVADLLGQLREQAGEICSREDKLATLKAAATDLKMRAAYAESETGALRAQNADLQAKLQQQSAVGAIPQGLEWRFKHGKSWCSMQPEANKRLSDLFKQFHANKQIPEQESTIFSGGNFYTINFKEMVQTNPKTRNRRAIKLFGQMPYCWSTDPEQLLLEGSPKRLGGILVPETNDKVRHAAEHLLRATAHTGESKKKKKWDCSHMWNASLADMFRVENFALWRKYRDHLQHMKLEKEHFIAEWATLEVVQDTHILKAAGDDEHIGQLQKGATVISDGAVVGGDLVPIKPEGLVNLHHLRVQRYISPQLGTLNEANEATATLSAHLDSENCTNEAWLFHGTTEEKMEQIVQSGFDSRVANPGYYGHGTYFASQSCKSHQYTCAWHPRAESCGCRTKRWMILARVALGCPYYTQKVDKSMRRPPPRRDAPGLFDSVVANPGPISGHHRPQQVHQEFVTFEASQAYPCFVLSYWT